MCGASLATVAFYQERVAGQLSELLDKQLIEHLQGELAEAQEVAEKGHWEQAEDMVFGTWDRLDTALANQKLAQKAADDLIEEVIEETEEAMAEPVTQVQPTLHVEVDDQGKVSTAKVKQVA